MPREPNEKVTEAERLYHEGMSLVNIAHMLDKPEGTVRRWKSTYRWEKEQSERSEKQGERSKKKTKKKAAADEVMTVMKNTDLTDKQQLFCIYYVRCFNATKAYQKAYNCSYTTAMVEGCKHLKKPKIRDQIIQLKRERLDREFLSEADIFQKYMDIAYADITDYMEFGNEDVEVILNNGEQKTITVSHVNIKDSSEVDGTILSEVSKGKDGVKVKLGDRMKALQWLGDHMHMATEEQKARIEMVRVQTDKIRAELNPKEEKPLQITFRRAGEIKDERTEDGDSE